MNKYSGLMFKVGTSNDWMITDSFASALEYFYMIKGSIISDAITGKIIKK